MTDATPAQALKQGVAPSPFADEASGREPGRDSIIPPPSTVSIVRHNKLGVNACGGASAREAGLHERTPMAALAAALVIYELVNQGGGQRVVHQRRSQLTMSRPNCALLTTLCGLQEHPSKKLHLSIGDNLGVDWIDGPKGRLRAAEMRADGRADAFATIGVHGLGLDETRCHRQIVVMRLVLKIRNRPLGALHRPPRLCWLREEKEQRRGRHGRAANRRNLRRREGPTHRTKSRYNDLLRSSSYTMLCVASPRAARIAMAGKPSGRPGRRCAMHANAQLTRRTVLTADVSADRMHENLGPLEVDYKRQLIHVASGSSFIIQCVLGNWALGVFLSFLARKVAFKTNH